MDILRNFLAGGFASYVDLEKSALIISIAILVHLTAKKSVRLYCKNKYFSKQNDQ